MKTNPPPFSPFTPFTPCFHPSICPCASETASNDPVQVAIVEAGRGEVKRVESRVAEVEREAEGARGEMGLNRGMIVQLTDHLKTLEKTVEGLKRDRDQAAVAQREMGAALCAYEQLLHTQQKQIAAYSRREEEMGQRLHILQQRQEETESDMVVQRCEMQQQLAELRKELTMVGKTAADSAIRHDGLSQVRKMFSARVERGDG